MNVSGDEQIRVRSELRPGDLGRIVELHGLLYTREFGFDERFEAYVARTLGEYVCDSAPESGRLWIAESSGQLVGCVGVVLRGSGEAQLRWLLVRPDARGHGLGQRLVEATMDFAVQMGCTSMYLWTVNVLTDAARLYRACGFELVEESDFRPMWGSELSEQRYRRDLADRVQSAR